MTKEQGLHRFGAVALVVLVAAASLWPLHTVDRELHELYLQSLARMVEFNARLSVDVLRVRAGIHQSYDGLRDDLREIAAVQLQLAEVPRFVAPQAALQMRNSVEALGVVMAERGRLVDQFASQAAIVKNSLTYLPKLLADVHSEAALSAEATVCAGTLRAVDQTLLAYVAAPTSESLAALQQSSRRFAQDLARVPVARFSAHGTLLASHIGRVVQSKPALDAGVLRLTSESASAELDTLRMTYAGAYADALQASLPRWVWVTASIIAALLTIVGRLAWLARQTANRLDAELRQGEITRAMLASAVQAAHSANLAKSAFLATMSHEIRTPLNGVLGMTHLALQTQLDERQRDYLTKIGNSGRGLLRIVNDILDFSKIEANRLDVEAQPLALAAVIGDVRAALDVRVAEKAIEFAVHVDTEVPAVVRGDRVRLTQVLLNLCGNAVKFTERGTVTLTVELASQTDQTATLRMRVQDTGIGMSDAQVTRLFEAFSQADASTTRRFGGSGLGLVISRRLVELMGGTIAVASTTGVGSEFTATVQVGIVAAEESKAFRAGSVSDPPGDHRCALAGKRVLLVEDNEINQQIAIELLTSAGVIVTLAAHGAEACERMRADFDAVLMDLQMPIMDGLTAARRILAQPEFAHVPIIAMTANAMIDDRVQVAVAGMCDFVAKPVEPEKLFAALAQWAPPQYDDGGAVAADDAGNAVQAVADHPTQAVADSAETIALRTAQWTTVDIESALRRLGGNGALLVRLLRNFAESNADAASRIADSLAAGNRPDALREAHTVKGVAANLGANGVSECAAAVEAALKANAPCDATIAALHTAVMRATTEIRAAIGASSVQPHPRVGAPLDELLALLAQLQVLVGSEDSAAAHCAARVAAAAGASPHAPAADRLLRAVQTYDFELAQQSLTQLTADVQAELAARVRH